MKRPLYTRFSIRAQCLWLAGVLAVALPAVAQETERDGTVVLVREVPPRPAWRPASSPGPVSSSVNPGASGGTAPTELTIRELTDTEAAAVGTSAGMPPPALRSASFPGPEFAPGAAANLATGLVFGGGVGSGIGAATGAVAERAAGAIGPALGGIPGLGGGR